MALHAASVSITAAPVLKQPNFRRLWYAAAAESVGDDVIRSLLPIVAVSVLGAGAFQVSVLTALGLGAFLVLGLPVGVMVDRMRKRQILIGADLFRALVVGSTPLAYAFGWLSIWHLFVVAALVSVSDVFFTTANSTVLPMVVKPQQLSEATARLLSAGNTISVAAPALSGALLRVAAAPFVLLASSWAYLASALTLGRMQLQETEPAGENQPAFWSAAWEGFGFTIRHPILRAHVASNMLINTSTMLGASAEVVFALTVLQVQPQVFAALGALAAGGALLGSVVAMPVIDRLGIGATRILASLASVPVVALIPLSASLPLPPAIWIGASGFGWSLLTSITLIAGSGILPRVAETRMLGRVSSCARLFTLGVMPVASLIGGLLTLLLGLVPVLWLWALVAGCAAIPIACSPIRGWKAFPEHLDVNAH